MKKQFVIICFSLFGLSRETVAQSRYNFIYDPGLGMNFVSENIASGHYLFSYLDNKYIPTEVFKGQTFGAKAGNIGFRMTKLFLLDYPLTFVLPSFQHERGGHGSRVLEFGGKINEINITLPPPFQVEFPHILFEFSEVVTSQQELMIKVGGSEANTVTGNLIRKNILLDDELDYHNAFIYLYANNDLPGYTLFAANSGTDISSYLNTINGFYSYTELSLSKIQLYGLLAIVLDPINVYAFNSFFHGYIWQGQNKSKIHLISLSSDLKYLPKFNFGLTPFGPELMLQNYIRHLHELFVFTIGGSDGTFEHFWRLGAEVWNWKVNDRLSLNLTAQLWDQPNFESYENNDLEIDEGLGGLLLSSLNYDFISNKSRLGLTLHTGYKTTGFVAGERFDSGLILRGGLSFSPKRQ